MGWAGGGAEPAGAGARAGARRGGGKKGRRAPLLPCETSRAVNLSRRKHGVDGEMATTREKEDTTTKKTTS